MYRCIQVCYRCVTGVRVLQVYRFVCTCVLQVCVCYRCVTGVHVCYSVTCAPQGGASCRSSSHGCTTAVGESLVSPAGRISSAPRSALGGLPWGSANVSRANANTTCYISSVSSVLTVYSQFKGHTSFQIREVKVLKCSVYSNELKQLIKTSLLAS